MLKNTYHEEYIFSINHHTPQKEALSYALDFLDKRLRELLKTDSFDISKSFTKNIKAPFQDNCNSNFCLCRSSGYYYHFLIVLDKKYKKRFNNDKAYIFKLLNNKKFKADFELLDKKADEEIETLEQMSVEITKTVNNFIELLKNYKIPNKFKFIIEELIKNNNNSSCILENLDNILIDNTNYRDYYNKLIYLETYDCPEKPELSCSTIKIEYDEKIDKKELKDSFLIISYLQDKYLNNKSDNKIKFDFDKYYKLIKLDKEQPNLTDCEKADIILDSDVDLDFGNLPTPEEDKKKIAIIRTMRARYKKYLK